MNAVLAEKPDLVSRCSDLFDELQEYPLVERIALLNALRQALSVHSPFRAEPVDCVLWVEAGRVHANDYNPNTVAPPEMELLRHSIQADGYTQPIVGMPAGTAYEVIDGFHRHRVGKECPEIQSRVHGYLPVVAINSDRQGKADRIAATIRHNRARGKHRVEAMSDIVVELKRRNWSDEKIGRELGMDPDEVLRLCQITGLAEAFKDQEFSEAWEVDKTTGAASVEFISDVLPDFVAEDDGRIYHTWDKWECYRAGFYAERPPNGMTLEDGAAACRDFLADLDKFRAALEVVISQWKHSCEHSLTNDRMNRIAWLGQASVAQALGLPAVCRGGFHDLPQDQQDAADALAHEYLNKWLVANGMAEVDIAAARGRTEAELY